MSPHDGQNDEDGEVTFGAFSGVFKAFCVMVVATPDSCVSIVFLMGPWPRLHERQP